MQIVHRIASFFKSVQPLSEGIYHYRSSAQDKAPYRLHLRLQKNGTGLLIVNASTVLQLNPTAAEYAYHFIRGATPQDAAHQVASRYRISRQQAEQDYHDFAEKIESLVETPDLDPVTVLELDQAALHSAELASPLRLDCALTYRLPPGSDPLNAPTKNVSRELTTAEWMTVLDNAWAFGIPHITFTGGEATLRDDLPDLIAHAEANGQVCGLLTDGHRLVDEAYLNTLLQTGLDHLMIVLPTQKEPNWQAIQNSLAADIFLAVHFTLTPKNAVKAEGIIRQLHQAGIEAISLSETDVSLQEQLSYLSDRVEHLGLHLVTDLPVPYSAENPVTLEMIEDATGAGRAWLYIEPDGDVLPSQGMAGKILGNILQNPLQEIYKP